jgi:hypothetical protein
MSDVSRLIDAAAAGDTAPFDHDVSGTSDLPAHVEQGGLRRHAATVPVGPAVIELAK